jgi:hypothetical protein
VTAEVNRTPEQASLVSWLTSTRVRCPVSPQDRRSSLFSRLSFFPTIRNYSLCSGTHLLNDRTRITSTPINQHR